MGEQSCNSCAVQRFLSAAPYAPPVVLQSFSCWVEKSPLGCSVHCYRSVNSILTGGFADVPFQNLAISARSNGSWLILSIEASTESLFLTMPLGSINDIFVEEAPKRSCRQQPFRGRQAYRERMLRQTIPTVREAAFREENLKIRRGRCEETAFRL